MINGAPFLPHVTEALACRSAAQLIAQFAPSGPVLDLGDLRDLAPAVAPRCVVTPTMFTADICALPFADGCFGAVVGYWVLDRLDGSAMPLVLSELARIGQMLIFILTHDFLPGMVMRSVQLPDGSFENEFSIGWFEQALLTWPGRWTMHSQRYRMVPGGVIAAWQQPILVT